MAAYTRGDEFDVPNLDALSNDPDDYDRAAVILGKLAFYARSKATAMRRRLAGKIDEAIVIEKALDRYHKNLPEWARW